MNNQYVYQSHLGDRVRSQSVGNRLDERTRVLNIVNRPSEQSRST